MSSNPTGFRRVIRALREQQDLHEDHAAMKDALERIKALADGYGGGNTEYAEGRKAGYRTCGTIAENVLRGLKR